MKLSSPNFADNQVIPADFTADGSNSCPDFYIEGVPPNAHSLVLFCYDPDATAGIPWVHWLAWNLPVTTSRLLAGQLPEGSIVGLNSFGNLGYGGPSPTPGTGPHRYVFTLFALRNSVDLRGASSYREVTERIKGNVIEKTKWTGTYERD